MFRGATSILNPVFAELPLALLQVVLEIGLVFRVEKIGGEDERGHGLLRTVGLDRQKAKRREGHVLSPLRECPRRLNEPGERVRLRRQDATLAVGFPPWRGLDGAGVRQPVHRDLRLYNTYQW